jgi:hypothetical protein
VSIFEVVRREANTLALTRGSKVFVHEIDLGFDQMCRFRICDFIQTSNIFLFLISVRSLLPFLLVWLVEALQEYAHRQVLPRLFLYSSELDLTQLTFLLVDICKFLSCKLQGVLPGLRLRDFSGAGLYCYSV